MGKDTGKHHNKLLFQEGNDKALMTYRLKGILNNLTPLNKILLLRNSLKKRKENYWIHSSSIISIQKFIFLG